MSKHNILITGGAGYLGAHLVKRLLAEDRIAEKLVVFSRDELKHFDLKIAVEEDRRVKFLIGDVRDEDRLEEAMKGMDIVIHTAAMKHVNICEENPSECIKTNIHGTENVLKAAQATGVKKLVFISTDKAVEPVSVYGNSKQVGEKLVLNADSDRLETVVLRLGNMIGSSGSIVDKLNKNGASQVFRVYNRDMTRFVDSLENAWYLVKKCVEGDFGGVVLVSKLKALNILDLAESMADEVVIDEGKNRGFEKTHEKLTSDNEMERMLANDDFYLITPNPLDENAALEAYRSLPVTIESYDSRSVARLTKKEIREWIGFSSAEKV